MTNHPVLITGFHRSGTSAVARILAHAGLDFGDNLLGAGPDNPHGHFEDLAVVAAHDAALKSSNLTWKSTQSCPTPRPDLADFIQAYLAARTGAVEPWALKDPRLCLFLGDWLIHVPKARVIHVVRQPSLAIESLHRRHARRYVDTRRIDQSDIAFWQTPDLGLQLWLHYTNTALDVLEQLDSSQLEVVSFDDRASLSNLSARCNALWDLGLSTSPTKALDPTLGTITPDLPSIEVRDVSLLSESKIAWGRLELLRKPQAGNSVSR